MDDDRLRQGLRREPDSTLDDRLEEVVRSKGLVSPSQIEECRSQQEERLLRTGDRASLGSLFVSRGLLSEAQVAEYSRGEAESHYVGKYLVKGILGRGGMGTVYEAEDPELRRRVALKVIRDTEIRPGLVERLRREATIVARLQHPNIVGIHEVGETRDAHFIVMDLIEGTTLAAMLRHAPRAELLRVVEVVARAAGHAHAKGVVHRDLKPANVLVDPTGRVVLTDFGLAHDDDVTLTQSTAVLGTPGYMAPEQVMGKSRQVTACTDVYALGVMLYEILAGRRPFDGSTPAELYHQILNDEPAALKVEAELAAIVRMAMAKEPERRYASANELADDVARFLKGERVQARPPGAAHHAGKWLLRRRALFVTAAIAVVIAVGVVIVAMRERSFSRSRDGAQAAHQRGDLAAAMMECDRALEIHDDKGLRGLRAMCLQGLAEAEAKRGREAVYRRLQDEKIKPFLALLSSTRPLLQRSSLQVNIDPPLSQVRSAITELETVAAAHPDLAEAWKMIGMGWYFLGDAREAEEALDKAVRLAPNDGEAHFYLGRIALERSWDVLLGPKPDTVLAKLWAERAAQHLTVAVRGWSRAEPVDLQVAEAQKAMAAGNGKESRRLCDQGLERYPDAPGAEELWLLRGWLIGGVTAGESFTRAIELSPRFARAYLLRALGAMEDQAHWAEAEADLSRAIRVNPRLAAAFAMRGFLRLQKQQWAIALEDCTRAIELNAEVAYYYVNRASVRFQMGEVPLALSDCNQAVRLAPDEGCWRGERAIFLFHAGDFDGAIRDASAAIEKVPGEARFHLVRGNARVAKGELEAAMTDLDAAVNADARDPLCYLTRGVVRSRLGRHQGAVEDYTKAVDLQPDDYLALTCRAEEYAKLGKKKEAIEDLQRALDLAPENLPQRPQMERMLQQLRKP